MPALLLAAAACGSANLDRASDEGAVIEDMRVEEVPVHGHQVVVFTGADGDGPRVEGELMAVDEEAVWVLDAATGELRGLPRANVAEVAVRLHDTRAVGAGLWGGIGLTSTLSHGYWLVISAPVWAITSIPTTVAESRSATGYVTDDGLDALFQFARFPQGLPRTEPAGPIEPVEHGAESAAGLSVPSPPPQ